jgi:hypothetical protein
MIWKPIEGAPKDGTEILLFGRMENGAEWYEVGYWTDDRQDGSEGWTEGRDLSLLAPLNWAELTPPATERGFVSCEVMD